MLTQTINRNSSQAARVAPSVPAKIVSLGSSITMMGALMPFARDAEIYGESEPADYLYKVVSGAVRTYKVLNDGRRQIGYSFCLTKPSVSRWAANILSAAEAVADVKIPVIRRSAVCSRFPSATPTSPGGSGAMVCRQAAAANGHIMLLATKNARAGRLLPPGNGGTHSRRPRSRSADVAPGHRRLSRAYH